MIYKITIKLELLQIMKRIYPGFKIILTKGLPGFECNCLRMTKPTGSSAVFYRHERLETVVAVKHYNVGYAFEGVCRNLNG